MIRKCLTLFFVSFLAANIMNVQAAIDDAPIKAKWSYTGNTGPQYWGDLNSDFALCKNGKLQSPIDVPANVGNGKDELVVHYHASRMAEVVDGTTEVFIGTTKAIINDGHTIQLNFSKANPAETITYRGDKYQLWQLHLHTPSETKLNGQAYPLEIHFVHQGRHGKVAVIGVFVQSGAENSTLQRMLDNLPTTSGKEYNVEGKDIDPGQLLPADTSYYSFMGSLTTPPCSEGLQWIVMKQPITASPEQIKKLKQVIVLNARPIQPLNDRIVTYSNATASN